jgi:hypothetical protein
VDKSSHKQDAYYIELNVFIMVQQLACRIDALLDKQEGNLIYMVGYVVRSKRFQVIALGCVLFASRRGVKQVRGKHNQGPEHLLDDSRQDIAVLAESKTAERRMKNELATGRKYVKGGAHRNAQTISSTTTVPAPTSQMLMLVRRALALSSSSGHLSGKSFEMSILSVLAS